MVLITVIKRLFNYIAVKNAVKQANRMHKLTRKRYYVIKIFKKARVYDRQHINFLINEGFLHQKMRKAIELQKYCIYYTGQPANCKPKINKPKKVLKPFKTKFLEPVRKVMPKKTTSLKTR